MLPMWAAAASRHPRHPTSQRNAACHHPSLRTPPHLGRGDEQVLQVVRVAAQPVLQRLHKVARVLRLVRGQELEHLGQRAHQLQQALLKVVVVLQQKGVEDGGRSWWEAEGEAAGLIMIS